MHTHEPIVASQAVGDRSIREVVILASQAGADVSRLMSQLAVRGHRVEVVKDEVAAVRRACTAEVELLIVVQPSSEAAGRQLAEAMNTQCPGTTLMGWDAAAQRLAPIGSPPAPVVLCDLPVQPGDDANADRVVDEIATPDSPAWADDDFAPEPLSAAELDALLGHAEPSGR